MTRIQIDGARCDGHGECVIAAPELFALDDSGELAIVLIEHPGAELAQRAAAAAKLCPCGAITVQQ
jgi:ferredoxin